MNAKDIEKHQKKIEQFKAFADSIEPIDCLYFSRYLLNRFITNSELEYEKFLKDSKQSD